MSLLRWPESRPEKLEPISSKKFTLSSDQSDPEVSSLQAELKSVKSLASSQIRDLQDKQKIQTDLLKSEVLNIKESIKEYTEENQLLKDYLKNCDSKITRLESENESLSLNLEQEQNLEKDFEKPEFQHQVAVLTEKIKKLHSLLKAEKLKTVDAIREKTEIADIAEMQKKSSEKKISGLKEEIFKEKQRIDELQEQLESKSRVSQSMDNENLAALNDHLQVKQRTIESLEREKESLKVLIKNEKEEKEKLQERKLNNRVVRQGLNEFEVFDRWPKSKMVVGFLDQKLQNFTDLMEEVAYVRGIGLAYLMVFHLFLVYFLLGNAAGPDFLPS